MAKTINTLFYVLYSDKTWVFDQSERTYGRIYILQQKICIVYGIESAAYGVIRTSCLCQKYERARYERVRAFDTNNECI